MEHDPQARDRKMSEGSDNAASRSQKASVKLECRKKWKCFNLKK